ncbi:MAG: LmeA family phospholipid-binding protein [Ornithinibacter sp.]
MKDFLLGVASTLALLVLLAVVGVLALGRGAEPAPTTTALGPGASVGARVQPPSDLGADETWLGEVELRSEDVVSPDGDLVDVVATGAGVRFSGNGLRAARLDIDATIPFDTVAGQVGPDVRLYAAGGGRAGVERKVTILGRDLTVRATGTVVADGGQLVIEPETVDIGGPSIINTAVSAIARTLVTIRQDVPGVPDGMRLTDVEVSGAGFGAQLTGTDVMIGR